MPYTIFKGKSFLINATLAYIKVAILYAKVCFFGCLRVLRLNIKMWWVFRGKQRYDVDRKLILWPKLLWENRNYVVCFDHNKLNNLEKLVVVGKIDGKRPRGHLPTCWSDQITYSMWSQPPYEPKTECLGTSCLRHSFPVRARISAMKNTFTLNKTNSLPLLTLDLNCSLNQTSHH